MVFWIYEDGVVRTRRHTGFASYADRLVEIDYAIRTLEHSSCRTGRDARCMRALITPGDLVSATRLRELTYINMLDVSACDRKWHVVLGLARRRACVTPDATRVVDYFRPLDRLGLKRIDWELSH